MSLLYWLDDFLCLLTCGNWLTSPDSVWNNHKLLKLSSLLILKYLYTLKLFYYQYYVAICRQMDLRPEVCRQTLTLNGLLTPKLFYHQYICSNTMLSSIASSFNEFECKVINGITGIFYAMNSVLVNVTEWPEIVEVHLTGWWICSQVETEVWNGCSSCRKGADNDDTEKIKGAKSTLKMVKQKETKEENVHKNKPAEKKAKVLKNEEANTKCLYCNRLFGKDKKGEIWVRCIHCRNWCHEDCAGAAKAVKFVCKNCKKKP